MLSSARYVTLVRGGRRGLVNWETVNPAHAATTAIATMPITSHPRYMSDQAQPFGWRQVCEQSLERI